MYNKINRDLGRSISLYADLEKKYDNKIYRFKDIRIYIYAYISYQQFDQKTNTQLNLYKFTARAKFDFDERYFTVVADIPEEFVGDSLKYGNSNFLKGHTWLIWDFFSEKSVIANIPKSILNHDDLLVEINADGTLYDPEAIHPDNGIIYGTISKYDTFYYVITMKENPEAGFIWESDQPHIEGETIYYYGNKNDINFETIDIPGGSYNIQGPMLIKDAKKIAKKLKKIMQPNYKSLYEITRFIELVQEARKHLSDKNTPEYMKSLEIDLKAKAKSDTIKHLSNLDGDSVYIEGL